MPVFRLLLLSCGMHAFLLSSCAPGTDPEGPPGEEEPTHPEGGVAATENGSEPDPSADGSNSEGTEPAIHANRLRLPDMEKLPEDSELVSGKAPSGGGGVIARPPSE